MTVPHLTYEREEIFLAHCYNRVHKTIVLLYSINGRTIGNISFLLTRELRALHGAWATPRSSSILEKTDRSSARSICRGLVPRIFTPFRCSGTARLFGICPPTDTMLPEQPWGANGWQDDRNVRSWKRRKGADHRSQGENMTTEAVDLGHTVGLVITKNSVCVVCVSEWGSAPV